MKNKGLISVIIPVYNVKRYIAECIDSVQKQTYQNYEIILVDDGSCDESSKICDYYSATDARIHCIHKENGGASTARNTGLNAVNGEYIFFLDSDDWLDSRAFEKLLSPMEDLEIDFSFCEAYAIDEDSGDISLKNYSYHKNYGVGQSQDILTEMISKKEFHVVVWTILFRKDFLLRNKLRFVEGIMCEDCIFTYQAYKLAGNIVHVHEYLYYRRFRRNSVTTSKKNGFTFFSSECAYEEVLASWKNYGSADADKAYLSRMANSVIDHYRLLNRNGRIQYSNDYMRALQSISENNAFSDKSLKAKCYGKSVWIIYKIAEKIFHL